MQKQALESIRSERFVLGLGYKFVELVCFFNLETAVELVTVQQNGLKQLDLPS